MLRKGAIEYFLNSPIVGNGIDTYKFTNIFGVYAHNNYAELLSGIGIFGLLAYYSLFVYMTIQMWKNRDNKLCLLFACIMTMNFVIEWYNVNYLQRGIFFVYSMAYCEYKLTTKSRSPRGGVQELANCILSICYPPLYACSKLASISYWRLSNLIKLYFFYGTRQLEREASV